VDEVAAADAVAAGADAVVRNSRLSSGMRNRQRQQQPCSDFEIRISNFLPES
jgi:hypothetical protein